MIALRRPYYETYSRQFTSLQSGLHGRERHRDVCPFRMVQWWHLHAIEYLPSIRTRTRARSRRQEQRLRCLLFLGWISVPLRDLKNIYHLPSCSLRMLSVHQDSDWNRDLMAGTAVPMLSSAAFQINIAEKNGESLTI